MITRKEDWRLQVRQSPSEAVVWKDNNIIVVMQLFGDLELVVALEGTMMSMSPILGLAYLAL